MKAFIKQMFDELNYYISEIFNSSEKKYDFDSFVKIISDYYDKLIIKTCNKNFCYFFYKILQIV